jgi:hypothetical protein
MPDELWDKAASVAGLIKGTPQGESFRRAFDLRDEPDDFAIRLSHVTAVYHSLREHPLLLGMRLNHLPDAAVLCADGEDRKWLEDAINVSAGMQMVVEYLRSHLPGYPNLAVPHLRQGSPYRFVSDWVFVNYFPWDAEIEQLTVGLGGAPPDLMNLGGSLDGDKELEGLAQTLIRRPTWGRLVGAWQSLDGRDLRLLDEMGQVFERDVRDEVVDREAGSRSQARFEYRMARLEELVSSAAGPVRQYLDAFERVHDLITVIAGLIETLVTSDGLQPLSPYRMDVGGGDDLRPVTLAAAVENPFINCGQAVFIPALEGAGECFVYPRSVSNNISFGGHQSTVRISGLLGSL